MLDQPLASPVKMVGHLKIELFDATGRLAEVRECDNLVVTAGKTLIADRMLAAPAKAAPTHMGVGTSATAVTSTDTDLIASTVRVALTSTNRTANALTYVGTFGAGVGTGTLAEAGIFNANVAGDMLCRTTGFTPIVKSAGDSMVVTWVVTIS